MLQPAIVSSSKYQGQSLAIASIFDSTLVSSKDKNNSLGISYGGISLDLKENEINKLRQVISQKLKYDYHAVADEKYLASFLTDKQLEEYVKCKELGDNNLHAELYWTDAFSTAAPGTRPKRTINIRLMFEGNNVVKKYKLDLKIDGKASKKLPRNWGNLKSMQAFMLNPADIYTPISIIANFTDSVNKVTTTASITIPPALPRINSRLKTTHVQTETLGNQCKGPSIIALDTKPIYASTSDSSVSYLANPKAHVTFQAGEATGNNSKVEAVLSEDRQQLTAKVVCQAHGTNGNGQINGYASAQDVAVIVDSIDY